VFGSSGVFFFGFLSSVKRSLFFVCDTTDRDDGNDDGDDDDGDNYVDETLVNDRLDTVDGVDGDIDNFVEEVFFSFVETNNLPCLFFWGVSKILPSLAMV
jgi:hypothetical protein